MKQTSIIAAILLLGAAQTAYCETVSTADTVVNYRGNTINIKESGNELNVEVFNDELRDKPYYEARYSSNKHSVRWELGDNVDVSFGSIFKRKKAKQNSRNFDSHLMGLQFGFNDALDADPDFDIVRGSSFEIAWNILSADVNLPIRNVGLALGIGLDWRNYRMDGNTRFLKSNGELSLSLYPDGSKPHYSRVKTFSVTLPVMLEWQLDKRGNFFIAAGGIASITPHSSVKNSYDDENGNLRKHTTNSVYHNPFNIDLQAIAGYKHIALYAKYTTMPVLDTSKAPKFHGLSCGIHWAF